MNLEESMFSRKQFWIITVLVIVVSIAGGGAIGMMSFDSETTSVKMAWKDVFEDLAGMTRQVDAVVLARATGVQEGRVAVSESGEDSVAFELVEFETLRPVKNLRPGETFLLERATETEVDGSSIFLDGDGGPFEVGARYLLFLQEQPGTGYYFQVNDQGRFRVSAGRLHPVLPDDPVARTLEGRSVADAIALVRSHLGARPASGTAGG